MRNVRQKVGESIRRRSARLRTVLTAGALSLGLTLTACSQYEDVESVPLDYPVGTATSASDNKLPTGTAASSPSAPEATPAPTSAETVPNPPPRAGYLNICQAVFVVNKPDQHTITLLPVSEVPLGQGMEFPKIVHLVSGGESTIEPAQPYRKDEYFWMDMDGHKIPDGQRPHCEQLPARVDEITPGGADHTGTEPAIVGPNIAHNQVLPIDSVADVDSANELYHCIFEYASTADLDAKVRELVATR